MIAYIMRHGEAERHARTDFDRNLTAIGKNDAEAAGRALASMDVFFNAILVSPLVRAQQTAEEVSRAFPGTALETHEHLTPESDPRNITQELNHFTSGSSVLLVTHEPFASSAISYLISGSSHSRILMRPASVACIEIGLPVVKGNGILHWLLTPEQMRSIAQK